MSLGLGLAPGCLVIDVPPTKHETVVSFWSQVLDAEPRWPEDEDGLVLLEGPRSVLPVFVQPASGVARFHIHLPSSDLHDTADRLLEVGAARARRSGDRWVLRDPAGLLFCLTPHEVTNAGSVRPRVPDHVYLDALFVDVPGHQVDTELGFWSQVLDAEVAATSRPETFTAMTGVRGPGGDLVVEVQRLRDGAPRFHVDLSTDDVDGEAQRVEALGATRVGQVQTWTTFADPAGNLFCVVPR